MTGFGKAIVEDPTKKITVEIKSLNSKQLDLSMKVPGMLREKELEMRNSVARKVERGKVEVNFYVENLSGETALQFNLPQMKAYKKQIEEMSEALGLPKPTDWYTLLLRFPETLRTDSATAADAADYEAAFRALDEALEAHRAYRRAEGKKLEEFFSVRIANIAALLAEVPQYESQRVEHIRARIVDNLGSLPQVDYDRARLEQEMIFYIEKLDINEEKQRLSQHLHYFMETMDGEPGHGKKLGFISQEMGREINTLGSKSNHAEMQRLVVRMKDELEQIKEQVLNVL